MANQPLYPDNYPGAENFALLCEGDRVGYEVAILRTWRDAEVPNERKFDIWPCGTGDGLFAIADAIGRTVRVVVVEDRDFRSAAVAESDCDKKQKDRARRNIAMRGWMAWGRNEVENYFLDKPVLVPVMSAAFRCKESDVLLALANAIQLLSPFQSLQYAVSEVRRQWDATEPSSLLVSSRPKWTSEGLQPVDAQTLEAELKQACDRWRDRFVVAGEACEPFLGVATVERFRQRWTECSSMTIDAADWVTDWAGKEILKLVRQQLASQFSGPAREPDRRVPPVEWHSLRNNEARNALDREIERAIQPALVRGLWEFASGNSSAPIRRDLERIESLLVV